jgi:choline monooxygenase
VVLTQDIQLLAGLQRGLHQPGFTHLALSGEERRVINMHRNLERYLNLSEDLPEAERINDNTADQNVLT